MTLRERAIQAFQKQQEKEKFIYDKRVTEDWKYKCEFLANNLFKLDFIKTIPKVDIEYNFKYFPCPVYEIDGIEFVVDCIGDSSIPTLNMIVGKCKKYNHLQLQRINSVIDVGVGLKRMKKKETCWRCKNEKR